VLLFFDIKMQINVTNRQTITVWGIIYVEIDIKPKKRSLKLKIVEELSFEIILRTNIIYEWKIILDFNTKKIKFWNIETNINIVYRNQLKK
jgi:hypothetical protein